MTVKEVVDKIKAVKEHSVFLRELVEEEHDKYIKDYLKESSDLLDEYVDALEQMKVQKT